MAEVKALWRYIARYNRTTFGGLLLICVGGGLALIQPALLGAAVDNVQRLLNKQTSDNRLGLLIALILSLGILEGVARFAQRFQLTWMSRKVEFDMRADLFRHIQTLDQAYFQTIHTGDMMSRATNDLNAVRNFTGMGIGNVANTVFFFVVGMVLMFSISVPLALINLVVLPFVSIAFWVTGHQMHLRYQKVQAKFADISTHAQENFSGIRVIKAYVQEDLEIEEFAEKNRDYIKDNLKYVQLSGMLWPLMFLILGLADAFILFVGAGEVIKQHITLGQFVQFNGYLLLLSWPMIALGWVVNLYQQGMASMTRILEVMNVKAKIQSSPAPLKLEKVRGEVEFRDVSLRYGEHWTLRHINFKVPAGTSCAIVGPTGAGKTSLVNLLARVYDPQEGEVLLDGVEVRRLALDELRHSLGYVPQDTFLFSMSLQENIAFGVRHYLPEQVEMATETARLSKDLPQISGGLQAMIGERGVTLSGGQKQRTAIARGVMRDPAVLILDDALSSIDTQTQSEILANLNQVLQGRTSLLISQRISTIKDCDQIVVLDNGQIIERGDHQHLLRQNGLYASMYRRELLSQELDAS